MLAPILGCELKSGISELPCRSFPTDGDIWQVLGIEFNIKDLIGDLALAQAEAEQWFTISHTL